MPEPRGTSNHALVDITWEHGGHQVGVRMISPGYAFPIFTPDTRVTICRMNDQEVYGYVTRRTAVDIPLNQLHAYVRLIWPQGVTLDPHALRRALVRDGWEEMT
jgi:hypothetical protein